LGASRSLAARAPSLISDSEPESSESPIREILVILQGNSLTCENHHPWWPSAAAAQLLALRGSRGTLLLAVYALGLGIPFLLVAAFLPRLTGVMGWMRRHMDRIEKGMGLLLWTIGLLMLTGGFSSFSYWLLETFPGLAMLG
jgi:hypothetical protein